MVESENKIRLTTSALSSAWLVSASLLVLVRVKKMEELEPPLADSAFPFWLVHAWALGCLQWNLPETHLSTLYHPS